MPNLIPPQDNQVRVDANNTTQLPYVRERDTMYGNSNVDTAAMMQFTLVAGLLTAAQKAALVAAFDAYFSNLFPFSYTIINPGTIDEHIEIDRSTRQWPLETDNRVGAPALDPVQLQLALGHPASRHLKYGGYSAYWGGWNRVDMADIEKFMQAQWQIRKAILLN